MQQLALKSGQGLTGWVARNRRPLVNARPSADLEAAGLTLPTALQSALVCPLVFGIALIGTLAVYHTTPSFYQRRSSPAARSRLRAGRGGDPQRDRASSSTHEDSLTDPLTGSAEHALHVHAPDTRSSPRAERLNDEVSLLVMDLNDFKEINDTLRPSRRRPRAA